MNVKIEPTGKVRAIAHHYLGRYRGALVRELAGISTVEVFWICKHHHETEAEALACADTSESPSA